MMIINYTVQRDGQYRMLEVGWWAAVEYKWNRATDEWRVAVLDSNASGRVPLTEIALAANEAIGMGEVPREKLVWARHGRQDHGRREEHRIIGVARHQPPGDGRFFFAPVWSVLIWFATIAMRGPVAQLVRASA